MLNDADLEALGMGLLDLNQASLEMSHFMTHSLAWRVLRYKLERQQADYKKRTLEQLRPEEMPHALFVKYAGKHEEINNVIMTIKAIASYGEKND